MSQALLLVGHGSLRPGSGAAMIRIAARLRERAVAPLTAAGFLNYSRPTLADALRRLVQRGATSMTVLPYFLVPGYFTEVALRQALDRLRQTYPQLPIVQAAPFGVHPALTELVRRRAMQAGADRGSAVLIAAHGSPDPAANAAIQAGAAQLTAQDVFGAVNVCYLGLNEPTIPAAIADQIAHSFGEVIIVPYLLQFGGHAAEDLPLIVAAAQQVHAPAQVRLAAHLGYDPLLADVLTDRFTTASASV